jgi:hypothetical protein
MAAELAQIEQALDDYAKYVEKWQNQSGKNCADSFKDFRFNGFLEEVKDLKYYEVKEIAGGSNKSGYNHFAIAIVRKSFGQSSSDFSDVIAVYDPIGHIPFIPGQIQDGGRQWGSQAWRNPETWRNSVLPWRYGNSDVYLGNNPVYLNHPYIPGHDLYGKTYQRWH